MNFSLETTDLENTFVNFAINDEKPKSKSTPSITNGISDEWIDVLIPDHKTSGILQLILDEIADLDIKPNYRDIFNFAKFTPLGSIKVIILSQEPHATDSHAHGLAFSSQMTESTEVLNAIYEELLKTGIIQNKPVTNNLISWAAQGVLLLNTSLTVLANKPGSHTKLWEPYMNILLESLAQKLSKTLIIAESSEKIRYIFKNHYVVLMSTPLDFKNYDIALGQNKINWNPDANTWVEVYTDGSSYPNTTGPAVESGYSAIFTAGKLAHLKIFGRTTNEAPYYSNNIRAEGTALLRALQRTSTLPVGERLVLHIVTDCEFWIKMIKEYIPNWIKKGGMEALKNYKNPDLTEDIWKTYCGLQKSGTFITISHVYSHDKKKGSKHPQFSSVYRQFVFNKLVDALANHARKTLKNGQYGEMYTLLEFNGEKY